MLQPLWLPNILTMCPIHSILIPSGLCNSSQALLCDQLRQNSCKLVQRKSHDVEVVSLYMLDKDAGCTLNAISSSFTKRLPCKQRCRGSLEGGRRNKGTALITSQQSCDKCAREALVKLSGYPDTQHVQTSA